MRKKTFDRDIVILLIFTLFTVISWVGFEVYRTYTQVPTPEVVQSYLQPFDYSLDVSVLQKIQARTP